MKHMESALGRPRDTKGVNFKIDSGCNEGVLHTFDGEKGSEPFADSCAMRPAFSTERPRPAAESGSLTHPRAEAVGYLLSLSAAPSCATPNRLISQQATTGVRGKRRASSALHWSNIFSRHAAPLAVRPLSGHFVVTAITPLGPTSQFRP